MTQFVRAACVPPPYTVHTGALLVSTVKCGGSVVPDAVANRHICEADAMRFILRSVRAWSGGFGSFGVDAAAMRCV